MMVLSYVELELELETWTILGYMPRHVYFIGHLFI